MNDRPYEQLVYALIFQAAKDYVYARDYLKNHEAEYQIITETYPLGQRNLATSSQKHLIHNYEKAEWLLMDCESFFKSEWCKFIAPEFQGRNALRKLKRLNYEQFRRIIKRQEVFDDVYINSD